MPIAAAEAPRNRPQIRQLHSRLLQDGIAIGVSAWNGLHSVKAASADGDAWAWNIITLGSFVLQLLQRTRE